MEEVTLPILHGGKSTNNLDSYRHRVFQQKLATSKNFVHPQDLSLISAAAKVNCFRTHLQVKDLIVLQSSAIDPENWGGRLKNGMLFLFSWIFPRHQRKFSPSSRVVVRDPVIVTGAAVIQMASNATLFANLAKELVALMLTSTSNMKKTCN